jgi:phosphatidylglycerol:prolipoprotein diacylglycerol transferase
MIAFPQIEPVIFSIGPVSVRWYGLMYVIGFAAAWLLARKRAGQSGSTWKAIDVDDLIFFAALGVIAGGRIGWILFYGFEEIIAEPMRALRIWEGGMSFHGGLLGVIAAVTWFAKRRGRAVGDVWDFTAVLPAIGLFTGRIGNFINGELWGKPTDLPWAVVYNGTPLHPSQLYEALLEGLVTFFIVWTFTAKPRPRWSASGLFLACYGVFRFAVEFVRVPDDNRGYLIWGWVTEGQLLSAPMIVGGVLLMVWAYRKNVVSGNVKGVTRAT